MTARERQAAEYYYGGYNCAQSVFASFYKEMGIGEEMALKLMASMGGGVSGMQEICGAVSGMTMALSMLYGEIEPGDKRAKAELYRLVRTKAEAFKAEHGSIICRDLLETNKTLAAQAVASGETLLDAKKPCARYVRTCARLVEEELAE